MRSIGITRALWKQTFKLVKKLLAWHHKVLVHRLLLRVQRLAAQVEQCQQVVWALLQYK